MSADHVVCVRLLNGDEVLGRADTVAKPGEVIELTRARHLLVQRTPEGLGVTLMPWSFCNIDGKVVIPASAVLAYLNPSAETVQTYIEQTTGIKLAI